MKNGLFFENDRLVYYRNDHPYHAGVIKVDGDIYYISSHGYAVKGHHIVHREMGNDILERGTYEFGDDYKLIPGSFIAPKKSKKKSKKKRRRMSKRTSIALLAAVFAMLVCTALLAAKNIRYLHEQAASGASDSVAFEKIILPEFEEDVLLCSSAAKLAYDGELTLKEAVQTGNPYRPFLFDYHFSSSSGVLYLSESQGMEDAQEFEMPVDKDYVQIDNLKTDTTYYYQVHVNGQVFSDSFHTAKAPRFVTIPGLVNTRDIGGYINKDGKKIKQGLMIRGVELDGLVNVAYFIPADELDAVQETFGFAYDLDLRESSLYHGNYTSRLNIPHRFYTSPMYGQIYDSAWRERLQQIFSDLADPNKYPMYLHCTWGMDRTGTIVFLLQGILNMTEEDMVNEYKLTSYVHSNIADSTNMDVIISGMARYEGNTLNERIVTFLTTVIGVTDEEIASIRSIFLED